MLPWTKDALIKSFFIMKIWFSKACYVFKIGAVFGDFLHVYFLFHFFWFCFLTRILISLTFWSHRLTIFGDFSEKTRKQIGYERNRNFTEANITDENIHWKIERCEQNVDSITQSNFCHAPPNSTWHTDFDLIVLLLQIVVDSFIIGFCLFYLRKKQQFHDIHCFINFRQLSVVLFFTV